MQLLKSLITPITPKSERMSDCRAKDVKLDNFIKQCELCEGFILFTFLQFRRFFSPRDIFSSFFVKILSLCFLGCTLASLLITPIQRVPRYVLLFQQFCKALEDSSERGEHLNGGNCGVTDLDATVECTRKTLVSLTAVLASINEGFRKRFRFLFSPN